jgi:hypothetical protein
MPQDQRPKTELTLEEFEEQAREHYKIPKPLWEAMKGQESGGNPNAVSPTGVRGRLQVTKKTAAGYGLDRDDPFHEVAVATRNLREGYEKYKNQFSDENERWLAATSYYYYGPGGVKPDGTLSTDSKDGLSNPAEHVSRVARRWKAYNDSQAAPAQTQAPATKPQPKLAQRQTAPISDTEQRRRRVLTGQITAFEDLKRQGKLDQANLIAADIKKRFGDIMEVGSGEGGWPYVKPKSKSEFTAPPLPSAPPVTTQTADDYNKQSWIERRRRNIATGYEMGAQALTDALARGVDVVGSAFEGDFRPLKEQAEGAGRGLLKLASAFDPVNAEQTYKAVAAEQDPALAALERRRAERLKNDPYTIAANAERQRLAAEEAAQPGFGAAVTRGVVSGGMQALPYIATGVAGGGVPALAGVAAAQSDFVRPEEAALNIAGATLPVPLTRALTPVINRAAAVLPGRVAPAVTRAAGQVAIGGGTNVATMAAAGERDPRKLAEGAVVGGVLSGADAARASRGSAPELPPVSGVAPDVVQAAADTLPRAPRLPRPVDAGAQAVADFGARLAEIDQMVPAAERPAAIEAARQEFIARRREAIEAARQTAQSQAAPPAATPETAPQPDAQQPVLPPGVQIIRQGEPPPSRQRGQRQIPLDIENPDGTVETVLVLAPDRIDGRRVNETMLRPMVEQALRPQSQPAAQPDVTQTEAVSSQPPPVQPSAPGRRQPPAAQFIPLPRSGFKTPRTPGGAIPVPESSVAGRKLLPPATGEEIIPTKPLSRAVREVISRPDPRFTPDAARTRAIEALQPSPRQESAPQTQPMPKLSKAAQAAEQRRINVEAGQRIANRNRQEARSARAVGDLMGAQKAYRTELQALQDAMGLTSKADVGRRSQLRKAIIDVERNLTGINRAIKQRPAAQPPRAAKVVDEDAPTAELPGASRPLLNQVNNPEGGIPPRTESLSGRFGALVRRQAAESEAAPQPRRKATETLSPVEYLKRQTKGEGIRVSDRGEAALLGAKEAGIVGLTNRNSKWRLSDAQTMLDEGGFMLEDGRRFTDPSVTESDVLEFLGATGKQGRLGTKGIDERLADEEAEYYARLEANEGAGSPAPEPGSRPDTATLPRLSPRRTPPAPSAPRRPGQRVGTPQPRRISETGALEDVGDFFSQMKAEEALTPGRPRTERLPVPKATEDNIAVLRARREALSRLQFDRRGELPPDLGDELRELGGRIIEFEAEQAKIARGGRPDLAPPGGSPERMTPPSPEDRAARRAALNPKPDPQAGRKIQHATFGLITEAVDQSGVPTGKLRVVGEDGKEHIIQNPRTRGNREASFVRSEPKFEIPADALIENRDRPGPRFARRSAANRPEAAADTIAIPEGAVLELRDRPKPKFVRNAEQRLKDASSGKLAGSGGQQLVDTAIVTGWKVYEKGMDFARWSAEVIKQAGEKVRPHLRAAWDQIQTDYNKMAQEVATRKATVKAGTQIAGRMARIARTPTSPVEISKLRAEFPNLSKEAFDSAMQRLNAEGRIALQRHDHPASMSPAERASAVKIGNDYFTAATFRERPSEVMGSGPGALQGMFEGRSGTKAKPAPAGDDLTFRERVGRKVATTQTMAQLLNPKTIGANAIGNAAFAGAKNLANVVAVPVDKFLSLVTKQRQVAAPKVSQQISDFKDGFIDAYHAVRSKDYASLADNRYELNNGPVFKGKVGGFFEDVLNIALRAPDKGAYLAAYNDSVQQILAAHGVSKTKFSLDKIHEQAKMEAQQATFQDSNLVSDFTVGLRNLLNKVTPFGEKANFGLGDMVGLKYARTPANLVARGIEYSPLGFAKAFYKAAKVMAGKGKGFDQREAALAFGRAFVGTAFGSGLGAALYSMGVITQPEQENRGVQAAERAEGLMGYQLNLSALKRYATGGLLGIFTGDLSAGKKQAGDVLMSYDWFQPAAFSLGMGAAAAKAFKNRKADANAFDDVLTQIDAVTSTLTDQSILRNIRDVFRFGAKSAGRKVATDLPASFVPSVLNQARQIIDDRARETSKEKGGRGVARETLEKVLNKLPGASQRLPERKDIVGRSIPSRLEGAGGAALVPIPGRFSQYNPHPVLSEMHNVGAGTTGVSRRPDETVGQFRARRTLAAEWLNRYGLELTTSKVYKSATKEERKAAVDYLNKQISKQSGKKSPSLWLFAPGHVIETVRESEREKRRKAQAAASALQ